MAFDPLGSRLIQHLNFVVYQSYDALLSAGQDDAANAAEDSGEPGAGGGIGGTGWLDDWSTGNGPATAMGPGVGGQAPGTNPDGSPRSGSSGGTPGPTRPPGTIITGDGDTMVRRVPPGGGGVQPNRRRPNYVIRLTITADDETKASNTVFTWDGDEFTETGLQ